jgi:hypothetical protein
MATMEPPERREQRAKLVQAAWLELLRNTDVELEPSALDYVVDEVLPSGNDWTRAWSSLRDESGLVLQESFQRAAELSREKGRRSIDRPTAEEAFHEIVESKYNCPYPFLIC